MAALPFHYYLALRQDWIRVNIGDQKAEEPYKAHVEGDLDDFSAEVVERPA